MRYRYDITVEFSNKIYWHWQLSLPLLFYRVVGIEMIYFWKPSRLTETNSIYCIVTLEYLCPSDGNISSSNSIFRWLYCERYAFFKCHSPLVTRYLRLSNIKQNVDICFSGGHARSIGFVVMASIYWAHTTHVCENWLFTILPFDVGAKKRQFFSEIYEGDGNFSWFLSGNLTFPNIRNAFHSLWVMVNDHKKSLAHGAFFSPTILCCRQQPCAFKQSPFVQILFRWNPYLNGRCQQKTM